MLVRVYFSDGEVIEGETLSLPHKEDRIFWIHQSNGKRIGIVVGAALRKIEVIEEKK